MSENPKGLTVTVYRGDYSQPGPKSYTIVDDLIDGPFEPTVDKPQLRLVVREFGAGKIVHAEPVDGPEGAERMVGPMYGGSYVATTDSRWNSALEKLLGHRFYGAVPLHDRWETQRDYDSMSR